MTTPYTPTAEDINAAYSQSGYPPVREKITVTLDTHTNWRDANGVLSPFVRMGAIPERFHEAINQLGMISACPAPDDKRDCRYTHDVDRWLRSIGVEAEFVVSPAPDDLQKRIDAAHAKGSYAPDLLPVRETIQAPSYGATETAYPYVFLSDLPTKFHDYLNEKAIGSACPAFREEHTAYWLYDMDRWLGAIGVKLEATFSVQASEPFELPDPDHP